MLRWRILLGTLIVGFIIFLGFADVYMETKTGIVGVALFPLLIGLLIPSCGEMIMLSRLAGARPLRSVVYFCTFLIVTMAWIAPIVYDWAQGKVQVLGPRSQFLLHATCGSWAFAALGFSLIITFMTEIYRYRRPGLSFIHVSATMFTILYLGFLSSFLVQIRLMGGLGFLVAFLLVVKMGDVGAYTIGRLFGRTKMAPSLSPGKTIEGAFGAILFSCFTSWLLFCQILPRCSSTFRTHGVSGLETPLPYDWLIFGVLIGLFGMIGDLAESMLKREAKRKDSSIWMPGFGGVLDLLDSILLAAPVAYALWAFGIIVP